MNSSNWAGWRTEFSSSLSRPAPRHLSSLSLALLLSLSLPPSLSRSSLTAASLFCLSLAFLSSLQSSPHPQICLLSASHSAGAAFESLLQRPSSTGEFFPSMAAGNSPPVCHSLHKARARARKSSAGECAGVCVRAHLCCGLAMPRETQHHYCDHTFIYRTRPHSSQSRVALSSYRYLPTASPGLLLHTCAAPLPGYWAQLLPPRAQSPLLPCGFTSRTTFARLLLTILCRLRIRFGKYLSLSRSPDLTYGARKAFFRVSHSGASSFSSSKQQAAAASRVTAERASILIASLAVSSSPTTPNTHTHTHQPLCHITPSPCALEFHHANRPRCTIRHADSTTSARTRLRHHFHDRTLPTPIQHELPTSRRRCPAAAAAWPRAGRLPAAGRFRAERLWRRTGPRTTARSSNGSAYGPIATGSIPATAGPARTAGPSRSQPGWRSEDNPLVSSAARHTVEHTNSRQDGRTRALDRRELRPQRVVWNGLSG